MIERKMLGVKTGHGFYRRVKDGGDSTILVLDVQTLDYRDGEAGHAAGGSRPRGRCPTRASACGRCFSAAIASATCCARPSARRSSTRRASRRDIAGSIDDVDRAMRWGFGWELGPFETLDAIGVDRVVEACGVTDPPPLVREAMAGPKRFRTGALPPARRAACSFARPGLTRAPSSSANAGASLVDLGDGVLAVEFHSKMNTIGGDTIEMLHAGVATPPPNFAALVVGSEAEHFSAGANLMLLLLEAQEGNWDEIDLMVRAFPARDDGDQDVGRCRWWSRPRVSRSAAVARSACTAIACRPRRKPTWAWSKSASA